MNRLRSSSNVQSTKSASQKMDVKPWKWTINGKENRHTSNSTVKCVLAANQAEQVMKGVKENATKTMSNVKQTFDSLSQKLRRSTRKRNHASQFRTYQEFDNKITPVKLYSPFGIETPSPSHFQQRLATPLSERKRLTPKRFNFVSPTGKFRKDVEDLQRGMQELNTVVNTIKSMKNKKK